VLMALVTMFVLAAQFVSTEPFPTEIALVPVLPEAAQFVRVEPLAARIAFGVVLAVAVQSRSVAPVPVAIAALAPEQSWARHASNTAPWPARMPKFVQLATVISRMRRLRAVRVIVSIP